ncbi:DedA family protein, partial [Streptomyces albidoflavus]
MTGPELSPLVVLGAAGVPDATTQQALGYPSLFLLIFLGALVPVVPTGAIVSGAAVVAFHEA